MLTYVDGSVALATLLGEPLRPPPSFWAGPLIASRLLEYEVWTRIHARGRDDLVDPATSLIGALPMVELLPEVLARARLPWPAPVRTLDALHLATLEFLLNEGVSLQLATFDKRLAAAASALGIPPTAEDDLLAPGISGIGAGSGGLGRRTM